MMVHENVEGNEESGWECVKRRRSSIVAADVSRRSGRSRASFGGRGLLWTLDQASFAIVIQNPPTHVGSYGAQCLGLAVNWDAPNRESTISKSLIFEVFLDFSRGSRVLIRWFAARKFSPTLCKSLISTIVSDISGMPSTETRRIFGECTLKTCHCMEQVHKWPRLTMNILQQRTIQQWSRCSAFPRRVSWLSGMIALALGFVAQSRAQNRDVSTLFPDPNQVKADYPADPERYAAFFALSITLNATAARPLSRAAYTKSFDYEGSYNGIETLHMQQGMRTEAYKDWAAQRDKLVTDRAFLHSVLVKYHVADLPKVARPAPAPVPMVQPDAAPGRAHTFTTEYQTDAGGTFPSAASSGRCRWCP